MGAGSNLMVNVTFQYSSTSDFAAHTDLTLDVLDVVSPGRKIVNRSDNADDGSVVEKVISYYQELIVKCDVTGTMANAAYLDAWTSAAYRRIVVGGVTYDVVFQSNQYGPEIVYPSEVSLLYAYTFSLRERTTHSA